MSAPPYDNTLGLWLGLAGIVFALLLIVVLFLISRAIRRNRSIAAATNASRAVAATSTRADDDNVDLTRMKPFTPSMLPKLSLDDDDPSDDPIVEDSSPELRFDGDAAAGLDEQTGQHELIALSAAGQTDRGLKRSRNEDAVVVDPALDLFIVADGMGGAAGGDFASVTAANEVRQAIQSGRPAKAEVGYPQRGKEVVAAVEEANGVLFEHASKRRELAGMGTTIVTARFSKKKQRVYVAYVGDSRCYRIRRGKLELLTVDHTLGAKGVTGPLSGNIRRAVGVLPKVKADLLVDKPLPDDLYLLCSDGMYKMLTDEQLVRILSEHQSDLPVAVDAVISAANAAGGKDNISVVLIGIRAAAGSASARA